MSECALYLNQYTISIFFPIYYGKIFRFFLFGMDELVVKDGHCSSHQSFGLRLGVTDY